MLVLAWCGLIQSVVGFSSALVMIFAFGAYATGHLPKDAVHYVFELWYLMIIFPALGTGLIIMIDSWRQAWRERSMMSMGSAAWNTFAQGYNMYSALDNVPSAWSSLSGLFEGDGEEGSPMAALVFLLAVAAVAGGALLTYMLLQKYSKQPIPLAHEITA